MDRALPARFGIMPHATRRIIRRQLVIGGVLVSLGLAGITLGLGAALPLLFIFMGVALAGLGRFTAELGEAAQVLSKAANATSSGHLSDADELLDYGEAMFQHRYVRRSIDLQRATMAMHCGELEKARKRADAAIVRPLSLSCRQHERFQILAAHALRALLRSSLGDIEGARADIEIVRKNPNATADSLARAELAAALLLERAGDIDALREHLIRERPLLLEHTHPRERAIVRAYQRMLKSSAIIYRTSAPRVPVGGEEPELADWAAKLSPGAASFVHASMPTAKNARGPTESDVEGMEDKARAALGRDLNSTAGEPRWALIVLRFVGPVILFLAIWEGLSPQPRLSVLLVLGVVAIAMGLAAARSLGARRDTGVEGMEDKAHAVAERRFKPTAIRRWPALVLFIVLPMVCLAIWLSLTPELPRREAADMSSSGGDELPFYLILLPVLAIVLIIFGWAAARSLRARRDTRRLLLTMLEVARDEEHAAKDLTSLCKSPAPAVAAQAHLSLAELAERRGDLPGALAECDAAHSSLTTNVARAMASEVLLPGIYAERAFLFAAMDRAADAHAEIALLAERYPSYLHLHRARFRVALVQKARQGDIAEAAALAEQTADLPLSPRDELLANLTRAAASPETAGVDEVERLRGELGLEDASRRWLEVVAPAALAAFSRVGASAGGDAAGAAKR